MLPFCIPLCSSLLSKALIPRKHSPEFVESLQWAEACKSCQATSPNTLTLSFCAGGTFTGTLTGLLSEDNSSDDSIIDDTGSESTHISKGITDDGDLFQDNEIGADLSDGSFKDADTDSDVSDF